jgi:hypothetical protein
VGPGPGGSVGLGPGGVVLVCVVWVLVSVVWVLVSVVWVEVEGSIGWQFQLSVLSSISSRVALVKRSVPLEDNPPAFGVQYFTVRHRSVTVTLPVWPGGQDSG